MVTVLASVQPLASLKDTVCGPGANPLNVCNVTNEPLSSLHWMGAVPPEADAVMVPFAAPLHFTSVLVRLQLKSGGSVIVPVVMAVQPL